MDNLRLVCLQDQTGNRTCIPSLAMHMLKANLLVTVLQICQICASVCMHEQQANRLPIGRSTAKACADVAVQETLQVAQCNANIICCLLGVRSIMQPLRCACMLALSGCAHHADAVYRLFTRLLTMQAQSWKTLPQAQLHLPARCQGVSAQKLALRYDLCSIVQGWMLR